MVQQQTVVCGLPWGVSMLKLNHNDLIPTTQIYVSLHISKKDKFSKLFF